MEEEFKSNEEFLAEMERRREAQAAAQPQTTDVPEYPAYLNARAGGAGAGQGGIVGLLLKLGWAKNERQANYILVGVIAVVLCIIAWMFWPSGSTPPPQPLNSPAGTPGATTPTP